MTVPTETTVRDAEIGFTWGETDQISYLRNDDGDLRGVSEDVIRLLQDLATGDVERGALPEVEADVVDRLERQGYVREDGHVERVHTPEDIRFWPRAVLFVGLFSLLATVAAREARGLVGAFSEVTPVTIGTILVLLVAGILIHEGGHYLASRPFFEPSIRISTINGVIPSVCTTTQKAWMLPRNRTRWINLAGPMAELVFALVVVGTSLAVGGPGLAVRIFAVMTTFQIVSSLLPVFHGDGYWLLVDTFNMVNLKKRGTADVRDRQLSWASAYVVGSYGFAAVFVGVGLVMALVSYGPVAIVPITVWGLVVGYAERDRFL